MSYSQNCLLIIILSLCTVLLFTFIGGGVLIGVAIYNLWFHPYSLYPGPLWARVSPLYSLFHAYRGDLHLDVHRCHLKYGSVVRYSPNRLVFNTAEAMRDIYGQGKNTQKSHGYSPHPYFPAVYNTHNCIDKYMHGRKRRVVSQGFSTAAIAACESLIIDQVSNLCDGILASIPEIVHDLSAEGQWSPPQDMSAWTNYLTLDVISAMTYGRPFGLLTSSNLRWLVSAIVSGNRHIYMRFAWPTLLNSAKPGTWYDPNRWIFPEMANERSGFVDVSSKYSEECKNSASADRKDIISTLLAARDPKTGDKLTEEEVAGEAHLMIAAGGDTTSTALASALFYLSHHPEAYAKLSHEIRATFDSAESIRAGFLLTSCHYLRAVIDEAMRLAPPAPGALWREVCAGGAIINGVHVPEGLDVGVCLYAIQHNEYYFPDPYAFQPERFLSTGQISRSATPRLGDNETDYFSRPTSCAAATLSSPDHLSLPATPYSPSSPASPSSTAPIAFAPFLLGPRACVAKKLAYLEMQLTLARLLHCVDFKPAPGVLGRKGEGRPGCGEMGRERREEFQIVDMFSSYKEGPVLVFRRRAIQGREGR